MKELPDPLIPAPAFARVNSRGKPDFAKLHGRSIEQRLNSPRPRGRAGGETSHISLLHTLVSRDPALKVFCAATELPREFTLAKAGTGMSGCDEPLALRRARYCKRAEAGSLLSPRQESDRLLLQEQEPTRRKAMTTRTTNHARLRHVLLATALLVASPTFAAEVTPERLANADKEPQNWLMNHRTYDAQRYSPLDKINTRQREEPQARLCGGDRRHLDRREPAVDPAGRGRLPLRRRPMGHRLQDRRPLGRQRPHRLAHGSQAGESRRCPTAASRCGAIFVVSVASYPARVIATDKETGKVAWETNIDDGQVDLQLTAAPLAVKDKIVVGAAGGDRGVRDFIAGARRHDRQARVAQIRGTGAGRARQRDLEGQATTPGRPAAAPCG